MRALWLVLLPGLALAASEAVTLENAACPPADYWMRTVEVKADRRPDGGEDRLAFETLTLASLSASARGKTLTVRQEARQGQGWANGVALSTDHFPPTTGTYDILPTGQHAGLHRLTPEEALMPVFPTTAISPGHTWTAEVLPSARLPVGFTMTYTFTGIETLGKATCAIVTSAGNAKGKIAQGTFAVKLEGRLSWNLAEHRAEAGRGEIRMLVQRTKPSQAGYTAHATKVIRVTKRKTDADPDPPASPGN